MHTSIVIYVYIFYLCKCISLLFHYLLFFGVKNKLLVLVQYEWTSIEYFRRKRCLHRRQSECRMRVLSLLELTFKVIGYFCLQQFAYVGLCRIYHNVVCILPYDWPVVLLISYLHEVMGKVFPQCSMF